MGSLLSKIQHSLAKPLDGYGAVFFTNLLHNIPLYDMLHIMRKINETRTCSFCQLDFHPLYGRPKQKYCSTDCYLKSRWGEKHTPTPCPICGKPANSTGGRNQIYCSQECHCQSKTGKPNPGRSNLVTKTCDCCGKEVTRPASNFHSKATFCDTICMGIYQSQNNIGEAHPRYRGYPAPYGAGWKAIKARIIARANNKCERCHKRKPRDIHHKLPVRYFSNLDEANEDSNLLALCLKCHKIEHRILRISMPLLDIMLVAKR